MSTKGPQWLKDSVFYEVYPPSYYDSNGDGIGDLEGIICKLDYIKDLGCNAIWINPCFESAYMDGGYDITDYYKIAPRYGTNEDMRRLCQEAKRRGMHVLLDLVLGHTSIKHPWFLESCKPEENEYTHRYVWSDKPWYRGENGEYFISGYAERYGSYMANFFYFQPALNYGYANPDPEKPWQLPQDHPGVVATRNEIKKIMRYWLDLGCSGFRVDMAPYLVKGDPEYKESGKFWLEIRRMLDEDYPEAAIVSEWFNPKDAIAAGFHMDFPYSNFPDRWDAEDILQDKEAQAKRPSFFRRAGCGNIREFVDYYLDHYEKLKDKGYMSLFSGNHDSYRLALGRDNDEIEVAFALLLSMPGVPFIYYGDEIGMDYIRGLKSKEGGYERTGTRTPMQWNDDVNTGFSTAPKDQLYLPVDERENRPTVAGQIGRPNSLLEIVRSLIALRKTNQVLCSDAGFEVVYAEEKKYPFVFKRFNDHDQILVAVNPSGEPVSIELDVEPSGDPVDVVISKGAELEPQNGRLQLRMQEVSYGLFRV